jgi:hypothetical protein
MTGSENPHVRPELELLLLCARTRMDTASSSRLRELVAGNLDWSRLAELAEDNGVQPLLYWQLKNNCREDVPQDWMERLQKVFQQNARRNLCLLTELISTLQFLRKNSVLAIPHKGPILAEQAYGNLLLRQFVDLDIVVRQRDIAIVHELMVSSGFQTESFDNNVGGIPGQYTFVREAGRLVVEIHTEETLRYFPAPLDLDSMSERMETLTLDGREVQVFSAEQALPLLCVHGSKHFWERLAWICDIAELTQVPRGVDWDAALANAERLGAGRMMLLGLALAQDLLGASLPLEISRRVKADSVAQSLAAQVRRNSFSDFRSQPGLTNRFWFRVRMRGNPWQGLRYVLRLAIAPTEEDWSRAHLHGSLTPIYALLRPFRLLRKYGLGAKTPTRNS